MALTKVHNRMVEGSLINVKDYGATGDGVTDDTAALKAAFAAGAGKSVYLPAGTYIINRTTETEAWLPINSNTEYFGDGYNSIIKIKDGYVQSGTIPHVTPFFVGNVSNVEIHDLCIDGNRANITHPAESPSLIYVIEGSDSINIYNCLLKNPGGDCVTVGSAGAVSLGGENIIIRNNIAENPGRSCFVLTSARDVIIADNLGYDADNSYVDIETDVVGTFVGNVTITGNIFRTTVGNQATGFAATGPGQQFNIVCSNNVFSSVTNVASLGGSTNDGIKFINNIGSGAYTTGNQFLIEVIGGLKNGEISGNHLAVQAGAATGGIWVRGPYRVNISNNTITNVGYSGAINVDDPYGLTDPIVRITNNSIVGMSAGFGISVFGDIDAVVSGNHVDVDATGLNGIQVTSTTSAIVSNNTVLSSGTTGNGIVCGSTPKVVVEANRVEGFDNCIYLNGSDNGIVVNNVAQGGNTVGLLLATSDYPTIMGNMLIDNTAAYSSGAVTGYFPNLGGGLAVDLPKFNRTV